MALPLKYNIRNIVVRKGSTLATAFTYTDQASVDPAPATPSTTAPARSGGCNGSGSPATLLLFFPFLGFVARRTIRARR